MMPEINQSTTRYQVAKECAGKTIEALLTTYLVGSFDAELLQDRIAETIHFFTRNAVNLKTSHSHPEGLEREKQLLNTVQPLIDLRDQSSPDILRVLAIGSPEVVNAFVMTQFQLGYARLEEWSRPLPTVNPGEVMRILTKRVNLLL